jgi:hypothetical protein
LYGLPVRRCAALIVLVLVAAALAPASAQRAAQHGVPRLRAFGEHSSRDPLASRQWWAQDVGADRVTAPGPGVPVVVVDTGIDLAHPEFAARPNTLGLNRQQVRSREDVHGTEVASVAAAPANGIGVVGLYPRARLESFDYHDAAVSDVIAGLEKGAAGGRAVINVSGGFYGRSERLARAVERATARGAIVVAAVGNERGDGSPPIVPASLPHVLTVGATDRRDRVAAFSSRSPALDLAAPGTAIPAAAPTFFAGSGYTTVDGTSFAAPLVAAATAWVWTKRPELDATQVEELMRRSARDIGSPGWDADTGYGIVDVPSALATPAPPPDPLEPNEDVDVVAPGSLLPNGIAAVTTPRRPYATLRARLERSEDPEDVYRVWAPPGGRVTAVVDPGAGADLELWGARTRSVHERGAARNRDLLAASRRPGSAPERVALNRHGAGAYVYVEVSLPLAAAGASYTLAVRTGGS